MAKKKPEPNPIEEAIGDRAQTRAKAEEILKEGRKRGLEEMVADLTEPIPQNPSEIPEEPSPQEMLSLEELNRRTEERLQDENPPQETVLRPVMNYPKAKTPVSKPDLLPVTKISSQESPPQKIDALHDPIFKDARKLDDHNRHVETYNKTAEKIGIPKIAVEKTPTLDAVVATNQKQNEINESTLPKPPAEDIELTNLRKYILEDGFVVATVAFHIVSLCAQPMTTPSTTMWDFKDRAMIPEMVLALLNQPGYLEGIWPSLRIVMGSNKGNAAWSAGISTTIAFFDVIRTLPALKELTNDS